MGKFLEAIRQADYRYIILAVFITIFWLILRAIIWRTLLREQATFSQVFLTINEGYVLNNLLPFRLGEIGRTFILSRKANIGFWEVFSTILIERILDLAIAVGLLLITIPFIVGADWAQEAAIMVGLLVFVSFFILYLLAIYRERVILLYSSLSERIPILQKFGKERVSAFFDGLTVLTDIRRTIQVIILMLVNWGIGVLQYTLLLSAFYPGASVLMGMFTLGVAALGVAAPSSPAAVGVFELSIVGALSLFKVDPSTALAYAITVHVVQIVVTGVFGLFGFVRDGESILAVYRKSQELPQNPQ